MPAKRLRRSPTKETADGVHQRLGRLEAAVGKLTRTRVNVRREEHDAVVAALRKVEGNARNLEQHTHDLAIQFRRIAQIQADLDAIKRAWERVKTST